MSSRVEDFLFEIQTEELPPKTLLKLGEAFRQQIEGQLKKLELQFEEVRFFATPRRLAVYVKNLFYSQPEQTIMRKGPTVKAAFDEEGRPTEACLRFAAACQTDPKQLIRIKTEQGEWVGVKQVAKGKSVHELLPVVITEVIHSLPISKRMRWGAREEQFVRPVHSVVMLYGDEIIEANILGCATNRVTQGHRFLSADVVTIPDASAYASLLESEGFVIADFVKRREKILALAKDLVAKELGPNARLIAEEDLLNEVTGLVEWPVALCGHFDPDFLTVPKEVLISAMQDHQRYFPIMDGYDNLLPNFITISNIESHDPARVIKGNERVLRARLSDAAFFYQADQKESLEDRSLQLKGIIYQAKLGTLYDKALRMSKLAAFLAHKLHVNETLAERAGLLAKADLTTQMVGEFPELQGTMAYYYAIHDDEPKEVALALKEQYLPRFAGDELPASLLGQILSITDKLDTLVGTFGINHIPTGDKDPYGLRRAALGILRILIENKINLDLNEVISFAANLYGKSLENKETVSQLLFFVQERLRAWNQERGVSADVFAAVAALKINDPFDVEQRIKAVQAFKRLNEASALSIANKRVSNILAKYNEKIDSKDINPQFFENSAETELAHQLEIKSKAISSFYESAQYEQVLLLLAELRKPVDDFFDHVMVMTEDKMRRENRLLLLSKLRTLFLGVADIALLQ